MSDFSDRLPNDQMRAEYRQAVKRAGELLALAYLDLEQQDQHEAQAA